jgi:hypothetical protein
MAVASPCPATENSPEQAETVYAVASDETFWMGEWANGVFAWKRLPCLPITEEAPNAD